MFNCNKFPIKQAFWITLLITLLFPATQLKAGLFDDKIDEAEKLIKLDGYERQAHELLQQAIIDDPTNAKVLYRAGEAYLKMGWPNEADKAFSNAYKVNRKYGEKIAEKYYSSGVQLLIDKNENKAIISFNRSLDFFPQPKLKKQIVSTVFKYANRNMDSGTFAVADTLFSFISKIEPSKSLLIGEKYFKVGNDYLEKTSFKNAHNAFSKAIKFDHSLLKSIESEIFKKGESLLKNNQFDLAEKIFSIGRALNVSFGEKVLNLYLSNMNITLSELEQMIQDYYDNKGEWAGTFKVEYIEKIKIKHISSNKIQVHAMYRYRAIPGNKKGHNGSGFDQRIFILKENDGKFVIVSMLGHNSARF